MSSTRESLPCGLPANGNQSAVGVEKPTQTWAMTATTRIDEFEELRPHLLAVAYRLTGTPSQTPRTSFRMRGFGGTARGTCDSIADLRAWLTTVVSRLSLDQLAVGGAIGAKPMWGTGCRSRS